MPPKQNISKSDSFDQKSDVAIHIESNKPASMTDDFILRDVVETTITPSKEFLAELERIQWNNWAYYDEQKSIDFTIARTTPKDVHDGNNLTRYANCLRRYINARNEVLILDFIPNHEQKTSAHIVHETGEPCLINEIRIALNGVLARQVRGNLYELHVVNPSTLPMDILTGHILRRGDSKTSTTEDEPWHGDFAPTIKLGRIEPASELHITMIYMKPGRVFTNELITVRGGEVVQPSDRTCFLHNGFTKYDQPDMIDSKKHIQLRNPMTSAPAEIRLGLYPQPYMNPRDIVLRAIQQMIDDLEEIAEHVEKSRVSFAETNQYSFGTMSITINGDELIARVDGFDRSIASIIASNVGLIGENECTHNSSHSTHPTEKETVIRITSPKPLDLFADAIALAIRRSKNLSIQFSKS